MIGFGKYGKKTELETDIKSLNDKRLINIDPSSVGFFDIVLKFNTNNKEICIYKEAVEEVRATELTPFWRPVMDPSIVGNKVIYQKGNKPATGYTLNEWRHWTTEMPKVDGKTWKVGIEYQYYAFLVWLINKLVKSCGWSENRAMEAVVLDSRELGHYYSSINYHLETTGSSKICEVFDLGNTQKILDCSNTEFGGMWHAGGNFNHRSFRYPLANLSHYDDGDINYGLDVGWLVLS